MKKNLKSFIIGVLRNASYKWPERNEALKNARVQRGLYQCASCKGEFKKQQVHLDHIDPVVDIKKGFTTYDDYIHRLFVPAEGFQVLCVNCHEAKTSIETEMRKKFKKKVDKKK